MGLKIHHYHATSAPLIVPILCVKKGSKAITEQSQGLTSSISSLISRGYMASLICFELKALPDPYSEVTTNHQMTQRR